MDLEKDKVMKDMECWLVMEHIKKCEKCWVEAEKYLAEETNDWQKQKDEEESVMYANNDCERD